MDLLDNCDWQRLPVYPGWQLQTYLLTWSTHDPPFKQGLLEHSLISEWKSCMRMNKRDKVLIQFSSLQKSRVWQDHVWNQTEWHWGRTSTNETEAAALILEKATWPCGAVLYQLSYQAIWKLVDRRPLHQYWRGHEFESHSGLNSFQALLLQLLKLCEYR